MIRKLFLIAFASLLILGGIAPQAHALYGLEKYWAAVYDSEGNVETGLSSVTIYDAGTTTVATVYADENGTALTNPITTGLSDGVFEFWTAESSVDAIVTDGVRAKKATSMTVNTPHRIELIAQISQNRSLKFGPDDFIAIDAAGTTVIPITTTSAPVFEVQNSQVCIVWEDAETSYAEVTFQVPADYLSGGAFKAFCDFDADTAPSLNFRVYVNEDGAAWDAAYTAQTPVDEGGTAGTPELVTLTVATDFASLAAGDIVTFQIVRDDVDTTTADLELYYVEFYYDAKN